MYLMPVDLVQTFLQWLTLVLVQTGVLRSGTLCCALLQISAMRQRPKGWGQVLDEKAWVSLAEVAVCASWKPLLNVNQTNAQTFPLLSPQ